MRLVHGARASGVQISYSQFCYRVCGFLFVFSSEMACRNMFNDIGYSGKLICASIQGKGVSRAIQTVFADLSADI